MLRRALVVAKKQQARKTTLGIRLKVLTLHTAPLDILRLQGGPMEDRSLEIEVTTLQPESLSDSHKTLELIEELGRDLDAMENAQPRRGGFFKFVRRQFFRGAKN
jgi:hypothetical protein